MTGNARGGLPRDLPASAQVSGGHIASVPKAGGVAAVEPATEGQKKIAQLLGDSVNLLLIVGLQLASVRCRMEKELERRAVERVTEQLDAALVQIRHLSVSLALEARHESPGRVTSARP